MKQRNLNQGKLINLMKQFKYFNKLNEQYGTQYLLQLIKYIEPYFLRKDKVLVNLIKDNCPPSQYLLIDGIFKLFQILHLQENSIQKNNFKKYISHEAFISLNQYKDGLYKLVSKQNCHMLKLPTKNVLDPNKYMSNYIQAHGSNQQELTNIQQKINLINELSEHIKKHKKNIQFDITFGLGNFDYNQLLLNSQVQSIKSHETVYRQGFQVRKIGLIIKGKIAVQDLKKNKTTNSSSDNILTFYKNDYGSNKKTQKKNQYFLMDGDWIFLDQYMEILQKIPLRVQDLKNSNNDEFFRLNKILSKNNLIATEDVTILWISLKNFRLKFNYQINYDTLDKWSALIKIKQQARLKNQQLSSKLKKNTKQLAIKNQGQQLPKIQKKVVTLGHNVEQVQNKTYFKSRIISQKYKKFKKQNKHIQISQKSLLGITIKKQYNHFTTDFNHEINELNSDRIKSFSKFSKQILNRKYSIQNKQIKPNKLSSFKINSQSKLSVDQDYSFPPNNTISEQLVMYPQKYEPNNLAPNMKKKLILAQKDIRMSKLASNQPYHKSDSMFLDQSKISQNDDFLNNKSNGSFQRSQKSHEKSFSPQKIYQSLAQKISFKFPDLDDRLRQDRQLRKPKIKSMSIKERHQTLKILQQIQRKKQLNLRRQKRINLSNQQNLIEIK